jgi:hypothetical protein
MYDKAPGSSDECGGNECSTVEEVPSGVVTTTSSSTTTSSTTTTSSEQGIHSKGYFTGSSDQRIQTAR